MLAALAVVGSASAHERAAKVVAIDADPRLVDAARVALTSWHVDVLTAEGPTPHGDVPSAIREAHRIVEASGANAAVWIDHASLWVYDDRTHALAVRPLPALPDDEATYAALALTMKTLLLEVSEETAKPSAPPPAVEQRHDVHKPSEPPSIHTARLMTLAGVRLPTNASDRVAPRFGLELSYFPAFARQQLGLAVAIEAGPSVLVDHAPYFTGTFTDTTASILLQARFPLRRWLALELDAGPGMHVSALEGSSAALGVSGRIGRIDASIETMLAAQISWRMLRVAPTIGTTFMLRYQHYGAGGVEVLDVPPAQMLYALRIGVELP